ncbi:TniQ family protein [Paenibacillus sp. CGMCC 1.16610]|uniref:TniQ family protein n=1 Tax=Paenibacillus sp. CGMCC 1.16610 TaxID=2755557 RepID=UPI0012F7A366|nr:TniQ family protein [Paenibacillus sp. CGMCC 1.16610]
MNFDNIKKNVKQALDKFALRIVRKQFCPLCLCERLYYRKHWDISIFTRCHIHNCYLLSTCTKCNSKITFNKVILNNCECGNKLSTSSTTNVENSDLSKLLFQKLYQMETSKIENECLIKLQQLDIDLIIFLILFLSFKISSQLYNLNFAGFHSSIDYIYNDQVISEASSIFLNWPHSFYTFLNEFKQKPKNNRQTG